MLRRYLAEHVVLNTQAVDSFATSMSRGVSSPEAKAWIYKRSRAAFLNDDQYLTLMGIEEIPNDVPGYVTQAIDRGENIYQFSTASTAHAAINALVTRIDHIKDFFRDIEEWSAKPIPKGENINEMEVNQIVVAKKWMTKVPRLTIEQAEQAADEWARVAGAGAKAMTKEGVVVIYQWPNGYYAVRFTDRNTMMRDGHDLQNCLRQGTYWDQVASGRQWVVAIRKPNDEAVVGMRWQLPEPMSILECKGKNNLPVTGQYVPYVTELLTYFKVQDNNNHDLRSAGIYMTNGHFGTFRDLAKKISTGGVDYYVTDSRMEGQIGDVVISCSFGAGQIGAIDFGEARDEDLVTFLNNSPRKLDLSAAVASQLEKRLLFQGPDGSWGSFEDVADFTRVGDISYWAGKDIIKARAGELPTIRMVVKDGALISLSEWNDPSRADEIDADPKTLLTVLKNIPVPITNVNGNLERRFRPRNIFFDKTNGFGTAQEVGRPILERQTSNNGDIIPGVYLVEETSGLGKLVFEIEDQTGGHVGGGVAIATVTRKKVDEIASWIVATEENVSRFIEAMNVAGFSAADDIEDNYILHRGIVPTRKNGYQPIEKAGEIVTDVTNRQGKTTTLFVVTTDTRKHIFVYPDSESLGGYEAFRLAGGTLKTIVFYNRGGDSFERDVGNVILRKYQVMRVEGIDLALLGGLETRYEKIVADPEQLIQMIESIDKAGLNGVDIKMDLGQLMKTADYQDKIHTALGVGPFRNLTKTQAARLYNVLNPMKRPEGPIKVSQRGADKIFDMTFPHYYIQIASSLTDFESVWIKHPTILERYKKVLESLAAKATQAIEEAGQAKIMMASSHHYENALAEQYLGPVEKLSMAKNREVKAAIEKAAAEVPPDAPATSRYAALNTTRRHRRY